MARKKKKQGENEYKGQTNDNKNGLKNVLCTDGKLIEFREREIFKLNTFSGVVRTE